MRIVGITTCVNQVYVDLFQQSFDIWNNTLDDLVIATDESTKIKFDATIVRTNAFTKTKGSFFNKGAGLNAAYKKARPKDWVLSFDCDIIPPKDWRENLPVRKGFLHGVIRNPPNTPPFRPIGFFQLWNVGDVRGKNPPFVEYYGHAGRYDTEFAERWGRRLWARLPFSVRHCGESRKHWCGVGNDAEMDHLMRGGVRKYLRRDERLWQ